MVVPAISFFISKWTWFSLKHFLKNKFVLQKKNNNNKWKKKKNWFIKFFINLLWQRSATIHFLNSIFFQWKEVLATILLNCQHLNEIDLNKNLKSFIFWQINPWNIFSNNFIIDARINLKYFVCAKILNGFY